MIGQPDVFAREDAHLHWPGMRLIRPMPNAMAWRLSLVAAGRWDADGRAESTRATGTLPPPSCSFARRAGSRQTGMVEPFVFNRRIRHPERSGRCWRGSSPADNGKAALTGPTRLSSDGRSFEMTSDTPDKQLLHLVIGGELKEIGTVRVRESQRRSISSALSRAIAPRSMRGSLPRSARSTTRRCATSSCTLTACSIRKPASNTMPDAARRCRGTRSASHPASCATGCFRNGSGSRSARCSPLSPPPARGAIRRSPRWRPTG